MNFQLIKNVHFIGIGGIGMSALARYFNLQGKKVSGYDRSKSELTNQLQNEGIHVYFEENNKLIPEIIRENPSSESNLIIYTPAIPADHAELVFFENQSIQLHKRASVLGELSKSLPTIAIAGTHGKTTTTSILTFLCLNSEKSFVSFVGGINENFNSNLVFRENPGFMICEADEYDRSFLKLRPFLSVITSMDADHLDIYSTKEEMQKSFEEFANITAKNGLVLINYKLQSVLKKSEYKTYGLDKSADYFASNISFTGQGFEFDFYGIDIEIKGLELNVPGYHNLENSVAAIALALKLDVTSGEIINSLNKYKGVKRRFEYHKVKKGLIYIDDYAHHPEEINAVISSLRKMYPGKTITGIFQPHLFSRTRDLADEFAKSLSKVDNLILMDIYPAREKPIEGITSSWLLQKVKIENKKLSQASDLIQKIEKYNADIIVSMGAGDIDQMANKIKAHFSE